MGGGYWERSGGVGGGCCSASGVLWALGIGDLSETCVLDYWQGAWGLVGSGGKWSMFCSIAVEHMDALPLAFSLSDL